MERKNNYHEIEELLGKDIPLSEPTASNDKIEMSEITTDPYSNVCISCEG